MAQRQYSDDEKAAVLAWYQSNKNNLRKTARQWEMPVATLQRWVNGFVNNGVRKGIPKKRKELHELFEAECRAALGAAEEVREGASYSALVTAAAISAEKMRLLQEKPTVISKNENTFTDNDEDAVLAAAEEIRFRRLVGDAGAGIASGVHEGDVSEV